MPLAKSVTKKHSDEGERTPGQTPAPRTGDPEPGRAADAHRFSTPMIPGQEPRT